MRILGGMKSMYYSFWMDGLQVLSFRGGVRREWDDGQGKAGVVSLLGELIWAH